MANYKPKTCKQCKTPLPLAAHHRTTYCSPECRSAARAAQCKEWRKTNPERIQEYNERRRNKYVQKKKGYKPKACTQCGTTFTPTGSRSLYCSNQCRSKALKKQRQQWNESHPEAVRAYRRKTRANNLEKVREAERNYSRRNAKRKAAYNAEWRKANKEAIKEKKATYYQNNIAAITEYRRRHYYEYRDAYIRRNRRWRAANPDKVGELIARRAQAELDGNATPELIQAKWDASDHACILCGQPIDDTLPMRHPRSRTLEHLTPICRGGRHDIDNLDFAHYGCNSSKGAKTLEEYRAWQARLQQAS